jgi:hypothetical protein
VFGGGCCQPCVGRPAESSAGSPEAFGSVPRGSALARLCTAGSSTSDVTTENRVRCGWKHVLT